MQESYANQINRLFHEDKEIILLGTAHVSKESARLVKSVIEEEKPETVCVELCESRYQSIRQKDRWQQMDIIKPIWDFKTDETEISQGCFGGRKSLLHCLLQVRCRDQCRQFHQRYFSFLGRY